MISEEFYRMLHDSETRRREILHTKGHDYTQGSLDRLANFKKIGAILKILDLSGVPAHDPRLNWLIYYLKHLMAVATAIKGEVKSEPLDGRFDDLGTYTELGRALFKDCKSGE